MLKKSVVAVMLGLGLIGFIHNSSGDSSAACPDINSTTPNATFKSVTISSVKPAPSEGGSWYTTTWNPNFTVTCTYSIKISGYSDGTYQLRRVYTQLSSENYSMPIVAASAFTYNSGNSTLTCSADGGHTRGSCIWWTGYTNPPTPFN